MLLVTLPEETPVNEVVETAFALEDRVGVDLGPVVVNGLYPPLEARRRPEPPALRPRCTVPSERDALAGTRPSSGRHRQDCRPSRSRRLAERLPLPQLRLPFLFTAESARPRSTCSPTRSARQVRGAVSDAR